MRHGNATVSNGFPGADRIDLQPTGDRRRYHIIYIPQLTMCTVVYMMIPLSICDQRKEYQ